MFDVDFTGIGNGPGVTFIKGSGVTIVNLGHVGKVSAAKTIDVCVAENVFMGVIEQIDVENEILTLERKGFKEVPYSGAIAVGWKELVADGLGGVKAPAVADTGKFYHVVDVNATDGVLTLDLG